MASVPSQAFSSEKPHLYVGKKATQVDPFLPLMPRKGDLPSIKKYGYLRVLFVGEKIDVTDYNLVQNFAKNNGLKTIYISIREIDRGEKLLKGGLADILLGESANSKDISKTIAVKTQKNKTICWVTRPDNAGLKNALNHFLGQNNPISQLPESPQQDLGDLKKRKVLRVVTTADPYNYFLKKGKPAGFEYELLQQFAKKHRLSLDVVTVEDEEDRLDLVRKGKADLATIISSKKDIKGIVSSFPFYPAKNFIITGKSEKSLNKLEDIDGKLLALHTSKYQHQGIERLMDKGFTISTIEPETEISTAEFLHRVIDQEYEVAMISSRDYINAKEFHDDLKVIATVNDQPLHRWAVNKKHHDLSAMTYSFLRKEFQGEFYNIVYKRYFSRKPKAAEGQFYISPYDNLVIKYAEKYNFDWRLVLAQMYQESKFRPDAHSKSGAKGLMQIMPRTARELGVTKIEDPETGIKAGLKYMKILRDRYIHELPEDEQNWFALASYNAGYERIQDARKFAKVLGLNPDKWFGHVEQAMKKLADPENRKYTRFGFCHCGQTVVYVKNIRALYNSYRQLSDPLVIASSQRLLTDNVSDLQHSPF